MKNDEKIFKELILNWKLRLVASAMVSIFGLAFLAATLSGLVVEMTVLDMSIVGIAVFVVMTPVYLIVADLPKIDKTTIAKLLDENVPELDHNTELLLKDDEGLNEQDEELRRKVYSFLENEKSYRYLPSRPIKQAVAILTTSLFISMFALVYFG